MESPDFTPQQRERIFERDGQRCLACGHHPATMQHRKAKGMGGLGDKHESLSCADGLLLCMTCNREAEASMQRDALRFGWKVPRNTEVPLEIIPYYDRITGNWWLANATGGRKWVDPGWASDLIGKVLRIEEIDKQLLQLASD